MKTSNENFLEKISKKALEKANELDTDGPKPEEVKSKKPYPVQKTGLVIPKGKMKHKAPKSYPIEQEVISWE
jgi:hypothetical protein